jgi:hypothetical protein
MKTFALTTLICAASLTAHAASIDGKWNSERQVGAADGKTSVVSGYKSNRFNWLENSSDFSPLSCI